MEIDFVSFDVDFVFLEVVVWEVGVFVLIYFGKDLEVWFKGNKLLVFEVDLVVDGFLVECLCVDCFGYGWLLEEIVDDWVRLDY